MDLIIIAGHSGSGKTLALGAIEDSGYHTVANLPAPLLADVVHHLQTKGVTRAGISLDVKLHDGLSTLPETLATLADEGISVRYLFLDTAIEILVKRYSETRRKHPLHSGLKTLFETIADEHSTLAEISNLGDRLDTSALEANALRVWIQQYISGDSSQLTLQFQSFGFKHGLPLDCDLVFDARCLPNPFYERALRPLTGCDQAVIDYLMDKPQVLAMQHDISKFLQHWLPLYARDNRHYLTVGIGCTGGQHRSVYLVEQLAAAFSPNYPVIKRHRELTPP